MTSIAAPSDVRPAGGLDSDAQGGATDTQLQAAIAQAQDHLVVLLGASSVGRTAYAAIRDYAGADADLVQKTADFKAAECYFALSFLPNVLTDAQLEKTGFKTQSTIGRATTTFGNPADVSAIADFWMMQGLQQIEEYLDLTYTAEDDDGDETVQVGLDAGPISIIAM